MSLSGIIAKTVFYVSLTATAVLNVTHGVVPAYNNLDSGMSIAESEKFIERKYETTYCDGTSPCDPRVLGIAITIPGRAIGYMAQKTSTLLK
jgi:hypothetical protein